MDSIEKIIKQVDENGDGEISFEEFVTMMKKIE
jgi:Ca2+-binding EF-hand superfamily protein